jgi:hypothetical protein
MSTQEERYDTRESAQEHVSVYEAPSYLDLLIFDTIGHSIPVHTMLHACHQTPVPSIHLSEYTHEIPHADTTHLPYPHDSIRHEQIEE